eukprot:8445694-Alexandrium_andersonii.AAC.1
MDTPGGKCKAPSLDGVPNARVAGRAPTHAKPEKKVCEFRCGAESNMPDDFCTASDPSDPNYTSTRWAYPDGTGANCH